MATAVASRPSARGVVRSSWYTSSMDYTGMEFHRLVQEVEDQGGSHLDLLHEPKRVMIPKPEGFEGATAQTRDEKGKPLQTTGCYEGAVLSVSYRKPTFGGSPETDQLYECGTDPQEGTVGFMANPVAEDTDSLVVCAACDDVGKWPRFAGSWEEEGDD